jgi:hypothetical protein
MGTIMRLVPSAILTVVGEVAVNTVSIPKKYSLVPIGGLVLAILVTIALNLPADGVPSGRKTWSGNTNNGGRQKVEVIEGSVVQKRTRTPRWHIGFLFFYLSCFMIIGASLYMHGSPKLELTRNAAVGLALLGVSPVLIAVAIVLIRGMRPSLAFSAEGITLTDVKGDHHIPWSQGSNFHTMKPSLLTVYLVATPTPGSRYYLSSWGFDKTNNLIRICDLTACGIRPDRVEAALDNWEP